MMFEIISAVWLITFAINYLYITRHDEEASQTFVLFMLPLSGKPIQIIVSFVASSIMTGCVAVLLIMVDHYFLDTQF